MGYFFVIRKGLAERWGLDWDERLVTYAYAEDLDFSWRYCRRAKAEGLRCLITPDVAVRHRISTEWRETPRAVTTMELFHREYLTYKWGLGLFSRLCTRWANLGTFLSRLLHHDHCLDVLRAQLLCDWHRGDIRRGILHTELFHRK